jgi:YVTN family beta-propeller protein
MKGHPIPFFGLLIALLLAGCSGAVHTVSNATGPAFLYVCNQGAATVSVIDMAANEVVKTIDLQQLGYSANAKPHHVVVEPDGSFWYLSLIGENKVLKFDNRDRLVGQADFEVPGMLALDPAGDRLVVGRSMSAVNPPQSIGIIQRSKMSIDEVDVFFPRPHALALSRDGQYAFAASLAENRIMSVLLPDEETELTTLGGELQTFVQFAVSPVDDVIVAGGQMSGQFLFFDISDPKHPRVTDTLRVGAQPWHPVFTPDGQTVYFGSKLDNSITAIDVKTRRVKKVIRGNGIAQPHGSAVSADGRFVYISNQNMDGTYTPHDGPATRGTVVVVDTQTNEISKVLEIGVMPSGLGTRGR